MNDVICPECGTQTDRIYELPHGAEEKGWMCEACVLDRCNMARHWDWTDADFRKEGVERVEEAED